MCISYNQLPISKNLVASPVHRRLTTILASLSNDVPLSIVMSNTAVIGVNGMCVEISGCLYTTQNV